MATPIARPSMCLRSTAGAYGARCWAIGTIKAACWCATHRPMRMAACWRAWAEPCGSGHKAAPTKAGLFSQSRRRHLLVVLGHVEDALFHRHITLVPAQLARNAGAFHLPHRETV